MLRYIARQPILNASEQTFGYELLYRAGAENFARITNQNDAARRVLDDLLTLGIGELARGTRVFLNCTNDLVSENLVTLLPTENVVLELLETVVPDHDLLRSCAELKAGGYSIALDDFVPTPNTLPLVEFADFIKVDFRALAVEECSALVQQFGSRIKFVAEKVETRAEFASAHEMGCLYFQGYFFAQPTLLAVKHIPALYASYLRLLAATCTPDFDFAEIEAIIKADVSLCYKLLRYLNSAAFCLHSAITSLRQALVILGENAIRRWVCVSAAATAASGKPPELLTATLLRARFCELLAVFAHCDPYNAFLVGLFSLMETLLDMPLSQVLANVQFPGETRHTLLGANNRLRSLFEMVCAYIRGDWNTMSARSQDLALSHQQITSCYLEAVRSVDAIMAVG
ncbi:MAG TPA: HDOD domain-containing protein [Candidatus Koribacter sp.]|jgi:EAL and modified HD-GYP domain-containing signal transduction protein